MMMCAEMHVNLHAKQSLQLSDIMKIKIVLQFFIKFSNIKFLANATSSSSFTDG